jgi:hypothetical protein
VFGVCGDRDIEGATTPRVLCGDAVAPFRSKAGNDDFADACFEHGFPGAVGIVREQDRNPTLVDGTDRATQAGALDEPRGRRRNVAWASDDPV